MGNLEPWKSFHLENDKPRFRLVASLHSAVSGSETSLAHIFLSTHYHGWHLKPYKCAVIGWCFRAPLSIWRRTEPWCAAWSIYRLSCLVHSLCSWTCWPYLNLVLILLLTSWMIYGEVLACKISSWILWFPRLLPTSTYVNHKASRSTCMGVDNRSAIRLSTACQGAWKKSYMLEGDKLNVNSGFPCVVNLQENSDYMCIYRICV